QIDIPSRGSVLRGLDPFRNTRRSDFLASRSQTAEVSAIATTLGRRVYKYLLRYAQTRFRLKCAPRFSHGRIHFHNLRIDVPGKSVDFQSIDLYDPYSRDRMVLASIQQEANESFCYVFSALRGLQAGRPYFLAMCPLKLIPKIFLFDESEI